MKESLENSINEIKDIMINVSTGKLNIEEINERYKKLYEKLNNIFKSLKLENPNQFSDLWEFHEFWKHNLPAYSERRNFIIQLYKENSKQSTDIFQLLNQKIRNICLTRFMSGHYADAVEAAFKEINQVVKTIVKQATNIEEDGASLMKHAFSPNNPIIKLDSIDNESGRSIQLGYMEIFSGSMIGIRNPKAHANIIISKEEAIHLLFLASLLMNKIEKRQYSTSQEYLEFYINLVNILKERVNLNLPKPQPKYFYSIPIRKGGIHFEWLFHGQPRNSFGVELHFEKSNINMNRKKVKEFFKYKEELENILQEEVIFDEEWTKKWSRIYFTWNGGIITDELKNWAIEKMVVFIEYFLPKL
jgi:uncharacterized protein (TIGR02391 family)